MIPRLCGAEHLRDYKILATFEDGKTGVIDLEHERWGEVLEPLRDVGLFRRFRFDLGATACVLVNAATVYASDSNAPLMSPARVDALQFRCGRWVDRTLERYGAVPASRSVVDVSAESLRAARRLAAMEKSGTELPTGLPEDARHA